MKVGIIGCGAISPLHIEAVNKMELGVGTSKPKITYLCDLDFNKAKEAAERIGAKATSSFEEVLGQKDIEVVHILTPHDLHTPMAIAALEAGKHVVLEKPVGISRKQMETLRKESMKAYVNQHAILNIILQNRYNPISHYLKKVKEDGSYGKLLGVKAAVTWNREGAYYLDSPWRGSWEREGGGLLINQCIHTLDLMQWIGGKVAQCKGNIQNLAHPYIEVEDSANLYLEYEEGHRGIFYGSNNHSKNSPVELEFVFEGATLTQRNEVLYLQKEGKDEEIAVTSNESLNGEKGYWGRGHALAIEEIYRNIQRKQVPTVSIDDAYPVHEMIFSLYEKGCK